MKTQLLALLLLTAPLYAQQNSYAAACGAQPANYSVKHVTGSSVPMQPSPGKAIVYIIETMPGIPTITNKVNIGLDGHWLGATDRGTYISFVVDPGVHHLCAAYQGKAASMQQDDQILLFHLDAKAGKTYYLHYHALYAQVGGVAFFDKVNEDEGQYLLLNSQQAVSKLK
jgi:hypothetical protein